MNTELILKARAFIADRIPGHQLNLNRWVSKDMNNELKHEDVKPECGSICCIGGWLATSGLIEHMQLTRVQFDSGTSSLIPWKSHLSTDPEDGGYFWDGAVSLFAEAFGITQRQADALFSMNGEGRWDGELDPDLELSHKELALARFDHLIERGERA